MSTSKRALFCLLTLAVLGTALVVAAAPRPGAPVTAARRPALPAPFPFAV